MERTLLSDSTPIYSPADRQILLQVASKSLAQTVSRHRSFPVDIHAFGDPLRQIRGSFVTLRREGHLRGCMGTLKAKRPLVEDVSRNAHASATRDPRFEAVTADEVTQLDIHISVLSEAVPIEFQSKADLLETVRPGIDGLIVRSGGRMGTLLPAVWEHIPEVSVFWEQLLRKAGLPAEYWSDDLKVDRYTTESFGGRFIDDAKGS